MGRARGWWVRWIVVACCLLGALGAPQPAAAARGESRDGTLTPLYADEREVQTYVAPPGEVEGSRAQSATIAVEYEGFPPVAEASFGYAVAIWESLLVAPLPIRVQATWRDLPQGVLGGAGPDEFYRDGPGEPWLPVALAKQIEGREINPGEPDIVAQFNNSDVTWYFGTGQTPPGQYNFITTVLHELGHGLGMSDSFAVGSGRGTWGQGSGSPVAFDRFVVDGAGVALLDTARYPNNSAALAGALQGGQLFFDGPAARAANGGGAPRLYAPGRFSTGSSISHLDEATFPPGSPNSLMTPGGARGETIYDPGPIALGILADLGWTIAAAPAAAPTPPTRDATERCFPQTGQCVAGRFLAAWDARGGLPFSGYPLTAPREETLEDGNVYLVQWFERVRMEYHPENAPPNDVLLGQFGRRVYVADPPVAPKAGQYFFPETGHNMALDFLAFWTANGGLAQFGYPIGEEIQQTLEDGRTYTVQYTERARLERHPDNPVPSRILLGQFGRRLLADGGAPSAPSGPAPGGRNIFRAAPAPAEEGELPARVVTRFAARPS